MREDSAMKKLTDYLKPQKIKARVRRCAICGERLTPMDQVRATDGACPHCGFNGNLPNNTVCYTNEVEEINELEFYKPLWPIIPIILIGFALLIGGLCWLMGLFVNNTI